VNAAAYIHIDSVRRFLGHPGLFAPDSLSLSPECLLDRFATSGNSLCEYLGVSEKAASASFGRATKAYAVIGLPTELSLFAEGSPNRANPLTSLRASVTCARRDYSR
jgi:hypothetical protein